MYYTEYVRHCMRFYARYQDADKNGFERKCDRENWAACDTAVKSLPEKKQKMVLEIYSKREPIIDGVGAVSAEHKMSVSTVWNILTSLESEIARLRGLK